MPVVAMHLAVHTIAVVHTLAAEHTSAVGQFPGVESCHVVGCSLVVEHTLVVHRFAVRRFVNAYIQVDLSSLGEFPWQWMIVTKHCWNAVEHAVVDTTVAGRVVAAAGLVVARIGIFLAAGVASTDCVDRSASGYPVHRLASKETELAMSRFGIQFGSMRHTDFVRNEEATPLVRLSA